MIRAILVVSVVWSSSALAQSSGAEAEALFRKGRELMAAGSTAEACAAFEDSQRVEPAVTTLLNLAGCREKLGQLATAWKLFADAERQTRVAPGATNQQLHDVAQARVQKLEPRLSRLTINVPRQSRLAGLEVLRGTERVDAEQWSRAQAVDGGTYTVTARAPGTQPWSAQITVAAEGDSKVVEVPDLRITPSERERALPGTRSTSTLAVTDHAAGSPGAPSLVLPLAVGAGAVVVLGGALGLELSAESKYDAAKAEMMNQARRKSLYDSANSRRYFAEALALSGLAAGGVAVWLYVRDRGREREPSSASVHVVPAAAGLAVVGQF